MDMHIPAQSFQSKAKEHGYELRGCQKRVFDDIMRIRTAGSAYAYMQMPTAGGKTFEMMLIGEDSPGLKIITVGNCLTC